MTPGQAATPQRIEDYALIGDCYTAALVGRNGSIDWFCPPRFDSGACFAALLGTPEHGRWLIAPEEDARITRRYRGETAVLETLFQTAGGSVALIDFMPVGAAASASGPSIVRIVEGRGGRVKLRMQFVLRFDYGDAVPWVERLVPEMGPGILAVAGPDQMVLRSPVYLRGHELTTVAEFSVGEGERVPFVLTHGASHFAPPAPMDAMAVLSDTEAWWRAWSSRCRYTGIWRDAVLRSLITLKALIYAPTGGIVAAPTTSLPERLGGARNWDYRFCWLRDATFTLLALMHAGYVEEAQAWRGWLHRAVAGSADQIQILYGLGGERRVSEWEATWLPGYQGAAPVRIGNAASGQVQLDVYGEVADALHHARADGLVPAHQAWELQCGLLDRLEKIWREPDDGIWEVRGGRRHFTFSKVMAWVAFDRAVRDAETYGLAGPVEHWKSIRAEIHATVCRDGFDAARGHFVQSFGESELDAALLLLPVVGFLPPEDARIRGTITAIERGLMGDGLVFRYRSRQELDGLPEGEGAFLACSFWMVDALHLVGRHKDATTLFERVLALRNDIGLLAEEYDPRTRRMTGNFPQAFSHLALIQSAMALSSNGPVHRRRKR